MVFSILSSFSEMFLVTCCTISDTISFLNRFKTASMSMFAEPVRSVFVAGAVLLVRKLFSVLCDSDTELSSVVHVVSVLVRFLARFLVLLMMQI